MSFVFISEAIGVVIVSRLDITKFCDYGQTLCRRQNTPSATLSGGSKGGGETEHLLETVWVFMHLNAIVNPIFNIAKRT